MVKGLGRVRERLKERKKLVKYRWRLEVGAVKGYNCIPQDGCT